MYKKMLCPILIILFTLFGCGKKAKDRIRIVMIEGIKHVQNPENPIKGIVHLDVEKVFEINPYQYEEVSLKFVRFIRGADGTVILFDGNSSNVEAHIVSSDREYLGRFLRLGQGPGEFPQFSGLRFYLKSDEIIVSGGRKLAIFDKSGNFIAENKMEFSLDIFLDIDRYFIYETRGQLEDRHEKIILKERIGEESSDFKDTLFFEAKNVGMIYTATVAFADSWATPRIAYSLDHKEQRFYVALNTEYKNFVKNLKGKILHVIEKKHESLKLSLEDKKRMVGRGSWIPSYPDKLVALQWIFPLPRGYLGVKRVSGLKQFEIDIFDPDGRYVYVIELDDDVLFNSAQYFLGGFATVKETDDGILYQEFLVKNLPEIWIGKKGKID